MLTSFCTVLASILEGLGVDFVPLEAQLGSNLVLRIAPEPPSSAQETSKSAQEPPKSRPRGAQERPRAAQDSPRASQKLTKMPRSSPRLDQRYAEILPRTWPETTHYPRLKQKLPTSPRTPLELLSEPQSGQLQKRAAAVLPTRGLQ